MTSNLFGGNLENFNAKYLEKQIKTNSALAKHATEIRAAHAKANPETQSEKTLKARSAKAAIDGIKSRSASAKTAGGAPASLQSS